MTDSPRLPQRVPYEICDGKVRSKQCEINIVEHCNLRCRACSHVSPVLPRHLAAADEVERDLSSLAEHYHVEIVWLLGGEPLLHPDLLGMIGAVRRSRVGERVGLVTNGVLLPQMPSEYWESLDEVRVSLYPGKELAADKEQLCAERAANAGVTLNVDRRGEFRESYSELGTGDDLLVQRIYDSCEIAHSWRCHAVMGGMFYKCPQAYLLPRLLGFDSAGDGVRIEASPGFRDKLVRYLESTVPLTSCRYCLGTAGRRFAHVQTSRREFRRHQQHPSEELVDEVLLAPITG
jgi:organic radical activating enzyme